MHEKCGLLWADRILGISLVRRLHYGASVHVCCTSPINLIFEVWLLDVKRNKKGVCYARSDSQA